MAENWSWESPTTASTSSPHTSSPLRSSPLQFTSSQSTGGIPMRSQLEIQQIPVEIQGRGLVEAASSPRQLTLVETLLTCLTSLPQSTTAPTTPPGRPLSDPSGDAPSPTLRQSRSGGGALSPSTSKPAGPLKAMKRRSRASRRVPTTVVEATTSDFRETVHRLTGIATPTPVPVRPQPKRISPVTFIRPIPQIRVPSPSIPVPTVPAPPTPTPARSEVLNSLLGASPMNPAFWEQLQRVGASSAGHVPQFDSFIKSEALEGTVPGMGTRIGTPQTTTTTSSFGSTMSQTVSHTTSWWDEAAHEQSQSYLLNPTTIASTGPFDGSSSQISRDDQDLSIDEWFHHDPTGSDYMR